MNKPSSNLSLGVRNEAFFKIKEQKKEDRSNPIHYRIAQAQLSGHLDLSNMDLAEFPEEVLSYYSKAYALIPTLQIAVLISINCSNNSISSIPDLSSLGPIKSLSASRNRLTALPLLNTEQLTELDLSYNEIETIDLSSLTAASAISINLSSNKLINLQLSHKILCSLLDLSSNNLTNFDFKHISYKKCILSKNKLSSIAISPDISANYLDLSYNKLREVIDLNNLDNLKTLNIAYNSISNIGDLPDNIVSLFANNNRLTSLNGSFHLPISLQTAVFDDNEISTIADNINELIPNITRISFINCDLRSIPIKFSLCENLTNIYLENNFISSIPERYLRSSTRDLLSFLKQRLPPPEQPSLKVSDIYKNESILLSSKGLEALPVEVLSQINGPVTHIDISRNKLTDLSALDQYLGAPELKSVILSYNPIKTLPDSLINNRNIKIIQATNCSLSSLRLNTPKLQKLHLARNHLKSLPEGITNCKHLIELDICDNSLSGVLSEELLLIETLELLDIRNNDITFIPYSFGNMRLKVFYIYGNLIRSIPQEFISSPTEELLKFLKNRIS